MPPDALKAYSPGLYDLVAQFAAFLRSDVNLRSIQSNNALQPFFFDQPVGGVTGNTIYKITETVSQGFTLAVLMVVFDSVSGTGRYTVHGPPPTTAGGGIPIPAGFSVLPIVGNYSISRFQMCAEAGQTLTFARYTFI